MMDRAEAIKVLSEWVATGANGDKSCTVSLGVNIDTIDSVFNVAIAALREQETVTNRHGLEWVSVKERLPQGADGTSFCELVVVYTVEEEVTTGWLNGDAWFLIINDRDDITKHGRGYVTHWMPLPEPPKEGADHERNPD